MLLEIFSEIYDLYQTNKRIKTMVEKHSMVEVKRFNSSINNFDWEEVDSDEIVPGDIVKI